MTAQNLEIIKKQSLEKNSNWQELYQDSKSFFDH